MTTAIRCIELSKKYRIGNGASASLRETVAQGFRRFFSKMENSGSEFWALENVSFDVQQGEVLGIIGKNGAGKSTLLKILSRITAPTSGSVVLQGRVASLLEVGTGFHPELTGRENIFMNGAILGMKRAEIRKKFDQIVAFSGIERFLETPVKRYSSGMYVRLAFAVAAHLEPEILIVDEVLAVGDAEFQKKCLGKMKDVSERDGRTVLFVSHNMNAVKALCARSLLLSDGKKISEGKVDVVMAAYLGSESHYAKEIDLTKATRERGKQDVIFKKIIFNEDHYFPASDFILDLKLGIIREPPFKSVDFGVHIVDGNDQQIYHLSNQFIGMSDLPLSEDVTYRVRIPQLRLKPGRYKIWLWMATKNTEQDLIMQGITLEVQAGNIYQFSNGAIISGITQPDFQFQVLNTEL